MRTEHGIVLATVIALLGCVPAEEAGEAEGPRAQRPPNVVLIVADDLGWRDVSFNGGDIATPHIDRIAAEGVRLDRFYVAPICSPTRAGLMTGRHPIRYGMMRGVVMGYHDYGLDAEATLIPEVLAEAGYEQRGLVGKWHLGLSRREYHPLERGFTRFVGHLGWGFDYFTHERYGEVDWFHDDESVDEPGYSTDLISEHAVRFVREHAGGDAPFFLFVPYNAPHSPFQAKEEDLPQYADLEPVPIEAVVGAGVPPGEVRVVRRSRDEPGAPRRRGRPAPQPQDHRRDGPRDGRRHRPHPRCPGRGRRGGRHTRVVLLGQRRRHRNRRQPAVPRFQGQRLRRRHPGRGGGALACRRGERRRLDSPRRSTISTSCRR